MTYLARVASINRQGETAMSPLPISLFALLSVVACAPVTSSDAPPGVAEGHTGDDATGKPPHDEQIRVAPGLEDNPCRAEAAQRFVGQQSDRATVQAAVAASGAKTVRVIKPDMMVTMDYRGDRLNIRVDASDKIIEVSCG
jgi:Peptidase inhibitor I78 family